MKEHRFTLTVKTDDTRRAAELAVLSAFAARKPDGCEFHLSKNPGAPLAHATVTYSSRFLTVLTHEHSDTRTREQFMKEHRFTLTVKTDDTRRAAELAVLSAFAARKPDGCEFHLSKNPGDKEAFMAGARSGTHTAYDLMVGALVKFGKDLGISK